MVFNPTGTGLLTYKFLLHGCKLLFRDESFTSELGQFLQLIDHLAGCFTAGSLLSGFAFFLIIPLDLLRYFFTFFVGSVVLPAAGVGPSVR